MDASVGIVNEGDLRFAMELVLQAVSADQPMKRTQRITFNCLNWIVLRQEAEERAPALFQFRSVRPNDHSRFERRCASGDWPRLPVYFDDT